MWLIGISITAANTINRRWATGASQGAIGCAKSGKGTLQIESFFGRPASFVKGKEQNWIGLCAHIFRTLTIYKWGIDMSCITHTSNLYY